MWTAYTPEGSSWASGSYVNIEHKILPLDMRNDSAKTNRGSRLRRPWGRARPCAGRSCSAYGWPSTAPAPARSTRSRREAGRRRMNHFSTKSSHFWKWTISAISKMSGNVARFGTMPANFDMLWYCNMYCCYNFWEMSRKSDKISSKLSVRIAKCIE